MKHLLVIFILLIIVLTVKSQVGEAQKYDCLQLNKLTSKQRLTNYPFNKAHRILLLSFPEKTLSFPLLNGSVDWENVKDSVTLNDDEIDSLSNILFNVGCRANKIVKNISTAVGVDIAIIFIGSSNDLVDYIEICFGCGEVDLYVSKRSKTIGITCNQKLNKLKQFSQACALRL